jgi:RimJ/RimL family protein N-acetyltransferase
VNFALSRCVLREWRDGDEPSLAHHADNPNVARHLRDGFPQPYTLRDAAAWIASVRNAAPPMQFAIVVDRHAVGGIGITMQHDIFRRSAEIGYWLGEDFWGRGIMAEAVAAVTAYAFRTFDLAHVFAGVFEGNRASARVLEKAGFALEGRLRKHVTKNGVTMDELVYGAIALL